MRSRTVSGRTGSRFSLAELFRVCACVRKCVSANGRVWKRENRTVHISEALALPTYFKKPIANRISIHTTSVNRARQEKKKEKVTRSVRHSAGEVKSCVKSPPAPPCVLFSAVLLCVVFSEGR